MQYQIVPFIDTKQNASGYIHGEYETSSKTFESTNLILADTYGELEQLQHRSKDKAFLEKYLEQLKQTAKFNEHYLPFETPNGFIGYRKELVLAWTKHIKNGLWQNLPQSTGELSDRVNFLLENTLVDTNARTIVTDYEFHEPAFD